MSRAAGAPPDIEPWNGINVPSGYRIRYRNSDDDRRLIAVENAAGRLFGDHGYPQLVDDGFSNIEEFRHMLAGGEVFVATGPDDEPAGFAVAKPLGAFSHLRELSVDPAHGRKGLGRALVETVIAAARTAGAAGVSLTTFRDVPFNQPFYETLGFRELSPAGAPTALAQAFRDEVPAGIEPAKRVLMLLTPDE